MGGGAEFLVPRARFWPGAVMMQVPAAAIALARQFEGFQHVPKFDPERSAHPYICPAGYWTIGYGHLCDPTHSPIMESEADVYLPRDLSSALRVTLRCCRRQRCAGASISRTGRASPPSCAVGFTVADAYCPGWSPGEKRKLC